MTNHIRNSNPEIADWLGCDSACPAPLRENSSSVHEGPSTDSRTSRPLVSVSSPAACKGMQGFATIWNRDFGRISCRCNQMRPFATFSFFPHSPLTTTAHQPDETKRNGVKRFASALPPINSEDGKVVKQRGTFCRRPEPQPLCILLGFSCSLRNPCSTFPGRRRRRRPTRTERNGVERFRTFCRTTALQRIARSTGLPHSESPLSYRPTDLSHRPIVPWSHSLDLQFVGIPLP